MHLGAIKRITVVGPGAMGHGIAQEFARAGYDVTLYGRSGEKLATAMGNIRRNLEEMAGWELLTPAEIEPALAHLHPTTSLPEAAGDADLVIEAIYEDLELKRQMFAELDRLAPERTILASNTSSLMPSMIAPATQRPDRVLVAHFFYPPHLMPLVELVRSQWTSDEVVQAVYDAVKAAGRSPIIAQKEALGFIANRIQVAIQREALYIVQQGIASAQDVDTAVKQGFGRRLGVAGPIEMVEVQDGWATTLQIHGYTLPDIASSKEPLPIIREKVARNEIGPRTGKGFYEWTPASEEAWRKRLVTALAGFMRRERTQPDGANK